MPVQELSDSARLPGERLLRCTRFGAANVQRRTSNAQPNLSVGSSKLEVCGSRPDAFHSLTAGRTSAFRLHPAVPVRFQAHKCCRSSPCLRPCWNHTNVVNTTKLLTDPFSRRQNHPGRLGEHVRRAGTREAFGVRAIHRRFRRFWLHHCAAVVCPVFQ